MTETATQPPPTNGIDTRIEIDSLRAGFGDFFVDYYLKLKQAEIDRFNLEVSDWEQREYFSLF